MFDVNRVILTGRLGTSPVMKTFDDGKKLVQFSLGTKVPVKEEEETDWHKIIVWGKLGDACTNYLDKGSRVCVEGTLRSKMWEDNNNVKRKFVEILANKVFFLDSGKAMHAEEKNENDNTPE